MIIITSVDSQKEFDIGVKGFEVVSSMFTKIANEVIAIKVNNELYDLSREIYHNANVSVITKNSDDGLEIIRHDAAHIMAQAVKELFSNIKIAIGPTIKDGFYYDFATEHTFSTKDFSLIEEKMAEIINRNDKFVREIWTREQALNFFTSIGEDYKVDIINTIATNEKITIYKQGNFIDLCRGPHGISTKIPKAFKLMRVAGAYWRGDTDMPMLQRIYGTAWRNEKELKSYLHYLEEIEKRDHRKIAKDMNLFHIQSEATGQIFWHEKGWRLYCILKEYIRKKLSLNGYIEVKTPILVNKDLWDQSGHWEKFRENMFITQDEEKTLAIKPMNCPCHVQIFNHSIKSYRDLPIRMAEFGTCHRNEPSGSLYGLMRMRGFVQDDAHIFCTEEQIISETLSFCQLLKEVYSELGFNEILVKFSDRPHKRASSDEIWDKAESSLKNAIEEANLNYILNPGEGAFYGPKLEFVLKDAVGREWQCGTLQMDFILPARLNAYYIGQDGKKHHVVMLHRAILGTFERFIGILLEHYSGKLPLWLTPIQLVILTITNECDDYAQKLLLEAKKFGIRVEFDLTREKIGYKIRNHSVKKVPVLWVVGKNEKEMNTVSVRTIGSSSQESVPVQQAFQELLSQANFS